MAFLVVLTAWLAGFASPASATQLPPNFGESTVFSGLDAPTSVAFAPDGRVFVSEKTGLIKVFDNLSDPTPETFADLHVNVYNGWDRGLLGLTLDPEFPIRPYVYVAYTYDAEIGGTAPRWGIDPYMYEGCPTPPGFNTDGCVVSGRVSRLEASGNAMVGTERVLVNDWCQQFPSHSLGDLQFGADGSLYAGGGDGASFTFVDYGQAGIPRNPCGDPPGGVGIPGSPPTAEGGALRSQDLRSSGDPVGLDGTLIRIDPDTGDALPGNPNYASSDPNARRIVAHGFRNPFRFTLRPGTNELWVGDVGWNDWEEIDRIPNPTGPTAANFGWPCYEGWGRQSGFDAANLDLCENLYNEEGTVSTPYYSYRHDSALAGESCPVGSSSLSGIEFYGGGTYPSAYNGALFFADYSRKCIWAMTTGGGTLPDPANVQGFATGAANPVDLESGPGGDLYYVEINPNTGAGSLRRITYFAGNQPPVAVATANPTNGNAPLTVQFDGTGSSDADPGDTLSYAWDLDGDGAYDDSTSATPSYTYTAAGNHVASLKVTDPPGASSTASVTISVGNTPPTATIESPANASLWQVGEQIEFTGSSTDAEEGPLPAAAYSWSLVMDHCPSNCHSHHIQDFSGVASGDFVAPDHEYPSDLKLKLTVTDAGGLQDTDEVRLDPRAVTLTMASDPPALDVGLNAEAAAAPFSRIEILGSSNSISAPSPQTLNGTTYEFSSWSDGGAQNHNVVADADRTLTATFAPTGGNQPPVAAASADPTSGTAPLNVDFDGTGSSDPDAGDTLTYAWDLDADGQFDDSTSATPSHTYTAAGSHVATLKVTDPSGAFDTASVTIQVAQNAPPTATIESPAHASLWQVGEQISFSGSATDPNETLPASAYSWTLTLTHCPTPATCHTHAQPGFPGVKSGSFVAPDHDYPSDLKLKLTVTDSRGLTDTKQVRLDPRAVTLTMASNPAGLQLSLNGETATATFSRIKIRGSTNTVSAPSPQTVSGTTYNFSSWSDGGAQSHNVIADASRTLTATFTAPAANRPPVAAATASPTSGNAPLNVNFSGTGSSDPDPGDTLSYAWDLDDDGAYDDSTSATPSYTYTAAGPHVARLKVTDAAGASSTASVTVTVSNTAPTATILTPAHASLWQVGQQISFSGSASDPNQTLPASAYSWQLNVTHCPSTCHTHAQQTFPGVKSGSFVAPDHGYPSDLKLILTVTDSGGLKGTKQIRLDPRAVTLTMASNPTGLNLTLNGQTVKAPFSRIQILGSTNSISAPTPQTLNGQTWRWSSWSDGGARTHNVVANATRTFTAIFGP